MIAAIAAAVSATSLSRLISVVGALDLDGGVFVVVLAAEDCGLAIEAGTSAVAGANGATGFSKLVGGEMTIAEGGLSVGAS